MKEMKRWISQGNSTNSNILEKIHIEKLVPGGDGLARNQGKVFFIPLVAPGETIDAEITEQKKKYGKARCLKIYDHSPYRVEPVCAYYGRCGGCNLQHLDYNYQVLLKKEFIQDLFGKMAGISLPADYEFRKSPPFGYRHRIQVQREGKKTGFKERSGSSVIEISDCPILTAPLNQYLKRKKSEQYSSNTREMIFSSGDSIHTEMNNREISYNLLGKTVYFRTDLFFQSNHYLLPDLIKYVMDGLQGENAMDLYCGTGLFSLFLKDCFKNIIAIEINPETEKYYHKNLEGSHYSYYGMSLEQWLKKGLHKKNPKMDLVVLDPPRSGISESVRKFLIESKPDRLVYVSCDPATQARDTKELINHGFIISDMKGFDFYPHSNHMENVIKFSRKTG